MFKWSLDQQDPQTQTDLVIGIKGLLLTFEGKRSNWQWKDETHVSLGTLIYVGTGASAISYVLHCCCN